MLSDGDVTRMSQSFVCVKLDPRETRDGMQHKTTKYVPELVVIDSKGKFVSSLESRSPPALVNEMRQALEKANGG